MNYKVTNCPNCGAPLSEDRHCNYCDTYIRDLNELNLNSLVDINLVMKQGKSTVVIPVRGYINDITILPQNEIYSDFSGRVNTKNLGNSIKFEFMGNIVEE